MPEQTVSVVVAVSGGTDNLDDCLHSLARQRSPSTEVIVVSTEPIGDRVRQSFPWIRFVNTDSGQLIPQLWSMGISEATGDVVAITTSHFTPASDWLECIQKAHARFETPAIGGGIDPPAGGRAVDWATYFLRYSAYLAIGSEQPVADFAGDNGTYKSWVFRAYPEFVQTGFWESDLHRQLCADDETLMFAPDIRITQRTSFGFGGFLFQRFRHGVQFGRTRVACRGTGFRFVGIAAGPLIPFLLLGKIVRRILICPRHPMALLYSIPVLWCFILAWSLGEVWGYMNPVMRGQGPTTHSMSLSG